MKLGLVCSICFICFFLLSTQNTSFDLYTKDYFNTNIKQLHEKLLACIDTTDVQHIHNARMELKKIDFLLRYVHEIEYKKINGVLPIEWETEVYEKWKTPYYREGSGLYLAQESLHENEIKQAKMHIANAISACEYYMNNDTVQNAFQSEGTVFYANRLFLLNVASIYTTGFENPDTTTIIPELKHQLQAMFQFYSAYNQSATVVFTPAYMTTFARMIQFVNYQPNYFSRFDNFAFIRDYVNILFKENQKIIRDNNFNSKSLIDYSISTEAESIFLKNLYTAQNMSGVYNLLPSSHNRNEIIEIGKTLFYDPILSGNNKRACASCHVPQQFFQDNKITSLQFNSTNVLKRNTPSLANIKFQHLLMHDGKHTNILSQGADVVHNPMEMNGNEEEIIARVESIKTYKQAFKKFMQYTSDKRFGLKHILSAMSLYVEQFSMYNSDFDDMMNKQKGVETATARGFNLFMAKAQCGTCHFIPTFNGSKPPYNTAEFEVVGTPADTNFTALSNDEGRYTQFAKPLLRHAFRTSSLRNVSKTAPYMHNGVFHSLAQVIEFYNNGGGRGKQLVVNNQTLSNDKLNLTNQEKADLVMFLNSLSEKIPVQIPPIKLPISSRSELNTRKVGGEY